MGYGYKKLADIILGQSMTGTQRDLYTDAYFGIVYNIKAWQQAGWTVA